MGAIAALRYVGALENIFTYLEQPCHEIVQVYEARFSDDRLYSANSIAGFESGGAPFPPVWKAADSFSSASPPCPEGPAQMLASAR
jgi:hypothetical protein